MKFSLQLTAGESGQKFSNTNNRSMGSVRSGKSVVAVDLAQSCEFGGKTGIVVGLAGIETKVLNQAEFTIAAFFCFGFGDWADGFGTEIHGHAKDLFKHRNKLAQRGVCLRSPIRSTHVRHDDRNSAAPGNIRNRVAGHADPGVIRYLSVFNWNVDVQARQNAPAGHMHVFNGLPRVHQIAVRHTEWLMFSTWPSRQPHPASYWKIPTRCHTNSESGRRCHQGPLFVRCEGPKIVNHG